MKLGISLAPALLCGNAASERQQALLNAFGSAENWLIHLRSLGVTHIELRAIRQKTDPADTAGAAKAVFSAGLSATAHGVLADEEADVFWGRFLPLLDSQPALNITVHSTVDQKTTLSLLGRMADYGREHHPDARLSLENNRVKKNDFDLVECAGVLNTVEKLNAANVGVCWDFGHLYWDHLTYPDTIQSPLPPEGFIRRAIHTHIHSVYEGTTHFPVSVGVLPLREYVQALMDAGFTGVFNLELEPERWPEFMDTAEGYLSSIATLKNILEACSL